MPSVPAIDLNLTVTDISHLCPNRDVSRTSNDTDGAIRAGWSGGCDVQTIQAAEVGAQAPVTLNVAGEAWRFSIASVTRVGRELFISVVLQGADICTAVVHVHDHIEWGVTAREILNSACEWLLARGNERHVYIELAPVPM